MVDSYEGPKIYFSDQNLQMDDEKIAKINLDEIIKKFKLFITTVLFILLKKFKEQETLSENQLIVKLMLMLF